MYAITNMGMGIGGMALVLSISMLWHGKKIRNFTGRRKGKSMRLTKLIAGYPHGAEGNWWDKKGDTIPNGLIVAWMPLPEPYRKGDVIYG